ncbi:MAG: bifunctional (p)ppGpp synthetase/guanosine-3',5'-bis(diphosphate) 3'-pyrophosphohydrolase [Spirochaetia bacterium]|nr:bifunctional (p)ppGpp synthetase/guanosine-3',5'-bis(diphosphate) 3'-pyrophosphohydrolase [Spirochaetia bacterium]
MNEELVKKYNEEVEEIARGFDEKGAGLIRKAYAFSMRAHENQVRMSGEPYVVHTIEVAKILKELRMDASTIAAGFVHDVIEDTSATADDIKKELDENVAFLVEGVSHVTAKVFKTRGEIFSESLKKMFLAMARDIRVIIIKLADRLHNMRTIVYLEPEKQKVISRETMNIYAPLAHRLGMERVKSELEDLSFAVLNPQAYRDIAKKVAERREERQKRTDVLKDTIMAEVAKAGIKADISGRPKHFYSIYNKMTRDNKRFENIYDLIALRMRTDTIASCYTILGIIHNFWKPVPGRFKDYIAMPKSNMYQSLHTTVLDDSGRPVEVQIRTFDMDLVAEEGIAAHWNYKENREYDRKTDATYVWIRQLLDWQTNMRQSDEFIKELKVDLFEEEVFVFTPKGEVKELVKGSTMLDFAYSVHSDLGDKCTGGKVNGKWVNLKYVLLNGDVIEVIKASTQHPTVDWLKVAKTSKAKNRIRHWLRTNQNLGENIEKGTNLLSERLSRSGMKIEDIPQEAWNILLEQNNLKEKEDILAGIGYGEFSEMRIANSILKFMKEKTREKEPEGEVKKRVTRGEIIVQGEYGDISYKFARCCNPVPGDDITGIYTKKGISIHRKNCQNLIINKIEAPIVPVSWNAGIDNYFMSRLKVTAKNRQDLVTDILNTVSQNNAFISSFNSNLAFDNKLQAEFSLNVKNQQHLSEIMNSLRKVRDVTVVERID